ncbi:RNHCP domain-containing protein [bacterium]|nr:RNHCP domain-containing protein [bacterium]
MKKINESFTCINCKKEIPLAAKTCRNHCPYCFTSLHVD